MIASKSGSENDVEEVYDMNNVPNQNASCMTMKVSTALKHNKVRSSKIPRRRIRGFEVRKINIRMKYKLCPNMILNDTPSLIAAPRISRGKQRSSEK